VQLDDAFVRAEADGCVVWGFWPPAQELLAGPDLGSEGACSTHTRSRTHPIVSLARCDGPAVAERTYLQEWHYFFEEHPPLGGIAEDHDRAGWQGNAIFRGADADLGMRLIVACR